MKNVLICQSWNQKSTGHMEQLFQNWIFMFIVDSLKDTLQKNNCMWNLSQKMWVFYVYMLFFSLLYLLICYILLYFDTSSFSLNFCIKNKMGDEIPQKAAHQLFLILKVRPHPCQYIFYLASSPLECYRFTFVTAPLISRVSVLWLPMCDPPFPFERFVLVNQPLRGFCKTHPAF